MKLTKVAGATSEIWQIFIRDSSSSTGAGLAGLVFNSASLTAYYHRDTDTTATVITLVTMTVGTFTSSGFKEIDATNMPGWYQFCPPNAAIASGAKSCGFHLKGATNMAPLPIEVQLTAVNPDSATAFITGVNSLAPPTNWNLESIDSNGRVDVIKIAGTSQTARDLGASVLLSSGTGAGQIDFTSGVVKGNVAQWLGTAVSTPTVAGVPNVNAKTWNDQATVALPLVPTTAGRTLDVSAGGEAGVDWANVGSPTTTLNLSATTIKTATDIATATTAIQADTDDIQTRLPAALVGGRIDANAGAISGDATAADNLETMLDGTGGQELSLGKLNVVNSSGPAIVATGGAGGHGITATGGSGGDGLRVNGGSNGDGLRAIAGSGTGKDIRASITGDLIGDIGGSLTGSVGSVTGAVGSVTGNVGGTVASVVGAVGSVTGAVGSVTGNVGGNVAGSVASVTGNVGGNVGGSVASVVARVTANTDQLAGQTVTAAAGVTFPTSVASPTNITAGTITTVGTLTTYTGNTPQTGDSFALANGAAGFVATKAVADAVKVKTDNLPAAIKKNVALAKFEFFMVLSTDHVSAATGLTVTAERSIDGGAFSACANAVSELSDGIYFIDLAAADLNGNFVTLRMTAATADDRLIGMVTNA